MSAFFTVGGFARQTLTGGSRDSIIDVSAAIAADLKRAASRAFETGQEYTIAFDRPLVLEAAEVRSSGCMAKTQQLN